MRRTHILMVGLALILMAANGWAQGFGIYEQSACVTGRGGATTAAPCNDGSSVFYNPAAIAFTTGPLLSLGGTIINPNGGFTPDAGEVGTLQQRFYQVPNVYLVQPFKKAAFGIGVFAPYGLTTDWPLNFQGRFLGYKTSIKGIYFQPTIAYKINDNVAIGGGLDVVYASLELNQRVDLSSQQLTPTLTFAQIGVPAGTDFANVKLSGHAWHVGFNAGVQAKVSPALSVGARYLSRQRFDVSNGSFSAYQIPTNLTLPVSLGPTLPKGTPMDLMVRSQFTGSGALAVQNAQTAIVFPDQLVAGLAVKVARKTTIFGDYTFTHWSLFDQIVITRQNVTTPTTLIENYNNTHGLRLGVEHELNKLVTVRGGFVAHSAAAPDETVTPLLPEGPRKEFVGGLGFQVMRNLRADLYYMYLMQSDRRGRTTPSTNNGTFNFNSNLFGITFSVGM